MENTVFEPLYKRNLLVLGNPYSPAGIVTLWTPKETVAKHVPQEHFAAIGQLYSGARGLNLLVRNLRYNPQIRFLFMSGTDLSGSGRALRDFFASGVQIGRTHTGFQKWKVISESDGFIDAEVNKEDIDLIRTKVRLIPVDSPSLVDDVIKKTVSPLSCEPYAQRRMFPMTEAEVASQPSERTGFIVRERKVAEAWVQILHTIVTLGSLSETHYEDRQKEVLNLLTIVTDENPEQFDIPEFLPCSHDTIRRYLPSVLTGQKYEGVRYTYGQRLRTHFGIDQIEAVIEKLVKEPISRSAVASLWDPILDNKTGGSPCLNHVWVRIDQSKLHLTAVIRSNDMYNAWPENAFSLRALQEYIRVEVSRRANLRLDLGYLTTLSQSAHIYEGDFKSAQAVIGSFYGKISKGPKLRRDPRGSFVVELDHDQGFIKVEHITNDEEHLRYFSGKTASDVLKDIHVRKCASLIEHASYLGRELQKAEIALQYPELFLYIQDRPLARKKDG